MCSKRELRTGLIVGKVEWEEQTFFSEISLKWFFLQEDVVKELFSFGLPTFICNELREIGPVIFYCQNEY